MTAAFQAYQQRLMAKSHGIARFFEKRMLLVALFWLGIAVPLFAVKLLTPAYPFTAMGDLALAAAFYAAIIAAPIAGYTITRSAFARADARVQPRYRFAFLGRWKSVDPARARALPAYGPVGFMASLLVGMVLNVLIRTGEFVMAVPVMGSNAPAWGDAMFRLMAMDVVFSGFFYMAAFAMALRSIPLFPRMLLFAWAVDLSMQLLIAKQLSAIGGIPPMVVEPLVTLLNGNIDKVLISAAIWLPYLLLSDRVNLTYRLRQSA